MFIPRDLPSREYLEEAARRYPHIDVTAVWAFIGLLSTAREVAEALEAHLTRHGLSQGRFAMVMLLFRNQPWQTPAQLADKAGVSRATVTGLLDKLERDGLIERKNHPDDRRKVCVCLTDAGLARIKDMMPDHSRRVGALMAGLDEGDRERLVELFESLRKGIPAMRDE